MTLIEKMARAIYAKSPWFQQMPVPGRAGPLIRQLEWEAIGDPGRERVTEIARAALSALLPPDEGTVEASLVNEWLSVAEAQACISSFVQHILKEDA